MTPQKTDPDLPGTVQESPAEVWVDGGLLQSRGTDYSSPGMLVFVLMKEVAIATYHSLVSGQTTGREHSSIHQQKIGLKIY